MLPQSQEIGMGEIVHLLMELHTGIFPVASKNKMPNYTSLGYEIRRIHFLNKR